MLVAAAMAAFQLQGGVVDVEALVQHLGHGDADAVGIGGIVRQQQLLGNVIRYQVECEAGVLTVDCLNRRAGDLLPVGSAVTLVVARDQLCEVA